MVNIQIATFDTETSGLNPKKNALLELGIVLFDSNVHGQSYSQVDFDNLPRLGLRIIQDINQYVVDDIAYEMNKELVDNLREEKYIDSGDYIYVTKDQVTPTIHKFLLDNGFMTQEEFDNGKMKTSRLNALGKNFASFDRGFLEQVINFREVKIKHRCFDPSMLYFDAQNGDTELPSLDKCIQRSGLFPEGYKVDHTSIQDCIDTLKVTLHRLI